MYLKLSGHFTADVSVEIKFLGNRDYSRNSFLTRPACSEKVTYTNALVCSGVLTRTYAVGVGCPVI